jgi:hypothetical protein
LLDAKTTAWFSKNRADEMRARAMDDYGIAGGAPGANASLKSNRAWSIVTLGNLDRRTRSAPARRFPTHFLGRRTVL